MVTSRRRRRKNNRCRCNRTELVEFQVSIFIYSYLCDQRDHQRDLTRLSRNPPEKEKGDSEKASFVLEPESYRKYLL